MFVRYLLVLFVFKSLNGQNVGCGGITISSATNNGNHTTYTYEESDGIRNGPLYFGSTIYCPENTSHPLASIVIIPGYANPESSIQDWGPFLASHGIVCMTIGTNSVFDMVETRRDALKDALISLKAENDRTGSYLYNKLDTSLVALGGWSMGGGGAQLLAAENQNIKAVIALCPWIDPLVSSPTLLNHNVPVLFFGGQVDAVAPPNLHAEAQYNYTPSTTTKLLYEVFLGGHTIANSPSGGQGDVGRMAVSWLKTFLEKDSCYCPLLLSVPGSSSDYQTNLDCSVITPVENPCLDLSVFPNPFKNIITVNNSLNNKTFIVYDLFGRNIQSGIVLNGKIDLSKIKTGAYFLVLKNSKSLIYKI